MTPGIHRILITAILSMLFLTTTGAGGVMANQPGSETPAPQLPLDDRILADKLVARLYASLAGGAALDTGKPKLAIAPIDPGTTGLGPDFAARLEASLTNALVSQNPGQFRIASRTDLAELVEEIGNFGSSAGQSEIRRLTRLFREAGGDYLLVTQFTQGGGGSLRLYLRAVSVKNGHIPAVASINNIAWQHHITDTGSILRSPEGAANAAARHLVNTLPDLDEVAISALYYGNSGFQGEFGTWWQAMVKSALVNSWQKRHQGMRSNLTFRHYHPKDFLRVPPALQSTAPVTENGITWKPARKKRPLETLARAKDSIFHLSGHYWDLGTAIEVQLEMRNRSGHVSTWRGRISRADIAVAIAPANLSLAAPRRQDGFGPVNLRMTSNHGSNPVLTIGDHFALQLTVDRSAWLTCYYQQADSAIMRIYPTRHDTDNAIGPGDVISIPDLNATYAFIVTPPAGAELIKCFATDRPVARQLPGSLDAQDFTPLPFRHINDIVHIWRNLPDAQLSEASMAITVLP